MEAQYDFLPVPGTKNGEKNPKLYPNCEKESFFKTITGVIESGLFIGYDVEVIMAE